MITGIPIFDNGNTASFHGLAVTHFDAAEEPRPSNVDLWLLPLPTLTSCPHGAFRCTRHESCSREELLTRGLFHATGLLSAIPRLQVVNVWLSLQVSASSFYLLQMQRPPSWGPRFSELSQHLKANCDSHPRLSDK